MKRLILLLLVFVMGISVMPSAYVMAAHDETLYPFNSSSSDQVNLKTLGVSIGTLSPAFLPSKKAYTVKVPVNTKGVVVMAVAENSDSTVYINDTKSLMLYIDIEVSKEVTVRVKNKSGREGIYTIRFEGAVGSDIIHVATNGDDLNGDGTQVKPYRTISQAATMTSSGIISVGEGLFVENKKIMLSNSVSLIGAGQGKTTVVAGSSFYNELYNPTTYNPKASNGAADYAPIFSSDKFMIQALGSNYAGVISNLTLEGNIAANQIAYGGICVSNANNIAIHDITVNNFGYSAVTLVNSNKSAVYSSKFTNNGFASTQSCTGAIAIGTNTETTLTDNLITENKGAYGMKIFSVNGGMGDKVYSSVLKVINNNIKLRQKGAWGSDQPNIDLELINNILTNVEVGCNLISDNVSIVSDSNQDGKTAIRVHNNDFKAIISNFNGYTYFIKLSVSNAIIEYNYFKNGIHPIADFSDGTIDNTIIRYNLFEDTENISVYNGNSSLSRFNFSNNVIVLGTDIPIIQLDKFVGNDNYIKNNIFCEKGSTYTKSIVQLLQNDVTANIADNGFYNFTEDGSGAYQVSVDIIDGLYSNSANPGEDNTSKATIEKDQTSGDHITINGKFPTVTGFSHNIALYMLYNTTVKQFTEMTETQRLQNCAYANQKKANPDGTYIFNNVVLPQTGTYLTVVVSNRTPGINAAQIEYMTSEQIAGMLSEFNAIKSKPTQDAKRAEAGRLIDLYRKNIDLTMPLYGLLADKTRLYDALSEGTLSGGTYTKLSEIKDKFDYESLIEAINQSGTGSLVLSDIINYYATVLGVKGDYTYDSLYSSQFTSSQKVKFEQMIMAKAPFSKYETFKKTFREQAIIYVLSDIGNWMGVKTLIKNCGDLFGATNVINYNLLSDDIQKPIVEKALAGKTFADILTLQSDMAGFINAARTNTVIQTNDKGVSGGGVVSANINTIEPPALVGYTDILNAEWAKSAIDTVTKKGIMAGDGNGQFRPNDNIKREEFAKVIIKSLGIKSQSGKNFNDISSDAWYVDYVQTLESANIVKGISDVTFGVGNDITRQDLAVMVYRAIMYIGVTPNKVKEPIKFTDDSEIADYAKEAMNALHSWGVISGMGDGTLMPNANATRAQVAKMMESLLNVVNEPNVGGVKSK